MTKFRSAIIPSALLAVACASCGSSTTETLTSVATATTAACPNGGVTISSGLDMNNNGVLDPSEVTSTQNVCESAPVTPTPGSLVSTTTLPSGDSHCPNGGVEIETGLDNGAGGGTAGDGVLQPGEVTSTNYVCNSSSGPTYNVGSTTPPASPAGAATISASGGKSSLSFGGNGGTIALTSDFGTMGGHVKVFNTGVVDASFTAPTVTFNAGAVPFTVTGSPTLAVYQDTDAGVESGDALFEVSGDNNLYTTVGGVATPITSLDIPMSSTVTFAPNNGKLVTVSLLDDLRNAGTINATAPNGANPLLQITVSSYIGLATSTISTDGTADNGGDAASLIVSYSSTFLNAGSIRARGLAGEDGGDGGSISISDDSELFSNSGTIDSSGGNASSGNGGNAGSINLSCGYAAFQNSGAISANGGSGTNIAGSGATINMYADEIGDFINSGAVSAKGGVCTNANTACDGGIGGAVIFEAYAGELRASGAIDTSGGDGAGSGSGGGGGSILIMNSDGDENFAENTEVPTGSIHLSGSLTNNAGDGGSGGTAGNITIELSARSYANGQEIELLGYTDIIANGGDGPSSGFGGGNGGAVSLTQALPAPAPNMGELLANDVPYAGPAGAVINYANVTANGGTGGTGGSGGTFIEQTQLKYYFGAAFEFASNAGALSLKSGTSLAENESTNGAGTAIIEGISSAQNSGAVDASGGDCSGGNCTGGASGQFTLDSDNGPVQNSGALNLTGGSGTNGGSANAKTTVLIAGTLVTNSADITCDGGDGSLDGGSGGNIVLFSSPLSSTFVPTANTGTLSSAGGTGDSAVDNGSPGLIQIDGENSGS